MIFVPEYGGVCSCRIVLPPEVYTSQRLSGDQPTFDITASSARTTSDSRPSVSERVHSSLPLADLPRLRPVDGCALAVAFAFSGRTNATRDPSGDATMLNSCCGVVHTADAAPPSIGTRQRSPFFGSINARPSWLQNAPASDAPASVNSRGVPASSEAYTFETPARSHTNTTCRPSGDHIGVDGWRMLISCSIVSGAFAGACGAA